MANEDNTRQMNEANGNSNNGQNEEVLAAIRALDFRLTGVEEIILARLNTTRPLESQLIARFDEINDKIDRLSDSLFAMREEQAAMREEQAAMREEQAAMREEQAAMRKDHEEFRAETNENFRLINKQLGILSHVSLKIHAEHELLEDRVSRFETVRAR